MKKLFTLSGIASGNSALLFAFLLSLFFFAQTYNVWSQVTIHSNDCSSATANWTYTNGTGGGVAVQQSGYWLVDNIGDAIISQAFDVSTYSNLTLTFQVATYGSGTNHACRVEYSTDNGTTWNASYFTSATPTSTSYISAGTWNIGTFSSTQFKLKWTSPDGGGKGVRIDNISFQGSTSGTTPPNLSAALNANVDAPFDVTFTDDASWRSAITSITIDGTALTAGYSVSSGKITFTPSLSNPANLLQSSGNNKSITVIATGYSNASVLQSINPGAASKLGIKTQPTAPSTNGSTLATQPAIYLQDQYGNTSTSTATVTASVGSGIWNIGGTTSVSGVNGTATFTDLTATSSSSVTGATISFTGTGLTGITSNSFNIPAPSIISLTNSTYTQDFNTLSISGTSSVLPDGWYFVESGSNANTTYTAGTGSSTSGDTYSFGTDGSTERCLGGLLSSSLTPTYGAKIVNNTGSELQSVKISYTGETWRVGTADRFDRIDFQYSTDATSLTTGTWTDLDILDYQNPGQATGNGSLQHSANIIGKITGLSIPKGSTFWIRWVDYNATGSDDGMGIDDLSITPLAAFPTVQSSNVTLNFVNSSTYNINWTKGNGASSIVFVKFDTYGSALPEDGINYNANTTIGLGDQIGSTGWYCVYNGSGALDGNVNITGFTPGQTVSAMVCEFNGSGTNTNYNTTTSATNPTSGSLPVTLSNFSYVTAKNNITLKWNTLNEKNNEGFDVERKINDNWIKIGFVKGKGNSNDITSYTFEENNLSCGKYEYRLKQIDYNGNFKYYSLNGFAEVGVPGKYGINQNYPNPFNPVTKIDYELPFDSRVRIVVYDVLGREIKNLVNNEIIQAGYHTVEFNASNLPSGLYFYRFIANSNGNDIIFTKKMMVIK